MLVFESGEKIAAKLLVPASPTLVFASFQTRFSFAGKETSSRMSPSTATKLS